MAWRAMALRLLKLMAGLGRAVPRGCRPNPGGTPGPVRITGRELMTAAGGTCVVRLRTGSKHQKGSGGP